MEHHAGITISSACLHSVILIVGMQYYLVVGKIACSRWKCQGILRVVWHFVALEITYCEQPFYNLLQDIGLLQYFSDSASLQT